MTNEALRTILPIAGWDEDRARAVEITATTLTDLFGVGPVIACYLIGFTGDVRRFASRDQLDAAARAALKDLVLLRQPAKVSQSFVAAPKLE